MDHFVTPAIRSTLGICRWRWESAFSPVELVFCLSAYSSRRRSASAKPGRIVSSLSAGGAALLAVASAASSFSQSPTAMEASVRGGKFCLDLRVGRIIDRNHIEHAHWWRRVSAGIPRVFYSPSISAETESAVRDDRPLTTDTCLGPLTSGIYFRQCRRTRCRGVAVAWSLVVTINSRRLKFSSAV